MGNMSQIYAILVKFITIYFRDSSKLIFDLIGPLIIGFFIYASGEGKWKKDNILINFKDLWGLNYKHF